MMRSLVLTLFVALATLPAFAQSDTPERPARSAEAESAPEVTRWVIRRDTTLDDRAVEVRLDSLGARIGGLFMPDGPIGTRVRRFEIELDGDAPAVRFQARDDGVLPETHARARELEQRARRLADAMRAEPSGRTEQELDATLADLFDVRGDIRRQRARALRQRAAGLREEAAQLDREAQRREADRDRIIEARKRDLLGDAAVADW